MSKERLKNNLILFRKSDITKMSYEERTWMFATKSVFWGKK